jgi:small subunit ribosomal protein S6e
MVFKINISHNGKTYKLETENEMLVGKKIGDNFQADQLDQNLTGYELTITGTSDLSGIPGFKGLEGPGYHKKLLTKGKGMRDTRKGIRLRKTNRGEEISINTNQINTKVEKEGNTKFEVLTKKDSNSNNTTPDDKPTEDNKEADPKNVGDTNTGSKEKELEDTKEEKAIEKKEVPIQEKTE